MGVVRTILLVAFVILCILLVLLVLVQNEDSNGMGGVFGGNSAAFGSHSASVLTKTTGVLVALFFVLTFALALLNKAPEKSSGVIDAAAELNATTESTGSSNAWFMEDAEAESAAEEVESVEVESVEADAE